MGNLVTSLSEELCSHLHEDILLVPTLAPLCIPLRPLVSRVDFIPTVKSIPKVLPHVQTVSVLYIIENYISNRIVQYSSEFLQ